MRTRRHHPSHRLPTALAALPIALLLAISACSSSNGSVSPTSTTTSSSTTSAPASGVEQQVEAGYRAFWDAYLQAANPMNPTSPALAAHASSDELQQVQSAFASHFAKGEVIRGQLNLSPHVTNVSGNTATVTDCYGDSTHVFDSSTGQQKDAAGDNHFQITATLVLDAGTWKVSSIAKQGDGCTPT
jgi:hypothetical protein